MCPFSRYPDPETQRDLLEEPAVCGDEVTGGEERRTPGEEVSHSLKSLHHNDEGKEISILEKQDMHGFKHNQNIYSNYEYKHMLQKKKKWTKKE